MKQTNNLEAVNGTSFHGQTIYATVNQLIETCGKPYYGDTKDKVQHEWTMVTEDGTPFTIYDWKEYRHYDNNELIEWHIGGHEGKDSIKGYNELKLALMNVKEQINN